MLPRFLTPRSASPPANTDVDPSPAASVSEIVISKSMSPAVQRFRDEIIHRVQGWVSERTPEMVDIVDSAQLALGVTGDLAEIGVHHGLFLLLLAAVRRGEERVRAFDIFDRQDLNTDHSGSGSIEHVTNAIKIFYGDTADKFDIRQLDSMSVRASNVSDFFPRPVRLLSIDGGHTQAHVNNDLNIAQEVLASGGIAILDDFFGPHWPSVTEGFFRYMTNTNVRLAPFMYFQNKLYLTTFSEQATILTEVKKRLDERLGDEMTSGHWKYTELVGFRVLFHG